MNRVLLYGFVVMPNHVHVIVRCPPDFAPNNWARVLKSSTSRLIVRRYQVEGNQRALTALANMVTRPTKQQWKVWEDGYLSKAVVTPDFLKQKLDYTHSNPTQAHWGLADAPEAYPWSSARFYVGDGFALIPVEDARELLA